MKKLLYSFLHLILVFILDDIHLQLASSNNCDEDLFYQPYVLVKKKKNGGDLASLRSSGFLDLRFRNRILLCINGPAVLYSDVERLENEGGLEASSTIPSDAGNSNPDGSGDNDNDNEELRFKSGELLVFNHECISVNKVPTNILKKMKEEQGKSSPEIMPDTQVMGRLVLGVYLIGNKDSYQLPELAWFKAPNWDYVKTKDKTVKDSSFILTNAETAHCVRLPDGTQVKIGGMPNSNGTIEVCKWTVQEADRSWYPQVFQRGYDSNGIQNGDDTFQESEYEFYECPDGDPERNIILTMSKTTPEPVSHANFTEFDPFSLFNPNIFTPHGYRKDSNGLSGGDERIEDKSLTTAMDPDGEIPCTLDMVNCADEYDMERTTLKDMQNVDPTTSTGFEVIAGECMALPVFNMDASCGGGNCNYGNRILELALELVPAASLTGSDEDGGDRRRKRQPDYYDDMPEIIEEEIKRSLPKWGNLDSNEHLKWKMNILNLVADIFSSLCMPFRADFAYTVARVFGWYVLRAHAYGENMGRCDPGSTVPTDDRVDNQFDHLIKQTDTWVILEKELERCAALAKRENQGKGLNFQWEVGEEAGKWKIPSIDGSPTKKRRKRAVDQTEYPTYRKRMSSFANPFFQEDAHLSRKKRSATSDDESGPMFHNRYVLPGKNMQVIKSEGAAGYAREVIQEYRSKPDFNDPRSDPAKYCDYPENIQHCWQPQEDPVTKEIVCTKAEDIFFYEDRAEIEYELNIAIDLWWKIWGTTIGFCNKAYHSRKSETFPRLYNSKYEYFFELVMKEWKQPQDNDDLKVIFSEYLTEENHIWLDACMEASYINSNSHSYRPPRPMTIEESGKEVSNYFEEVPTYLYYRYHPEPSVML